jgi:L-lactate dehydrogenase complex protein LldG
MGREQILANLRNSLASTRPWLAEQAAQAPHQPPPYVLPPAPELAAQFAEELGRLEGRVYRVADDEEALDTIGRLLEERGAGRVIAWELDQIGLPGLDALLAQRGVQILDAEARGARRKERLQALEPAEVCISGAEAAIAESGTLVLRHGPGRPRLASLLAPAHIAVLRERQLVRGLGEALALLHQRYGDDVLFDVSNLTLITGPSRTADIEMTLALGIHGPPQIHVVLIGEAA